VIAPLVASAGTNIKVMEAMAMGKAVVSTPAGVNGLDLRPGSDFILTRSGPEMAAAIENLLSDSAARSSVETAGRKRVESEYGWDAIARKQAQLYRSLLRR
jgi:glycosyltransferase involved in cell wall biosynthesis